MAQSSPDLQPIEIQEFGIQVLGGVSNDLGK